jgi:hypothetical protein
MADAVKRRSRLSQLSSSDGDEEESLAGEANSATMADAVKRRSRLSQLSSSDGDEEETRTSGAHAAEADDGVAFGAGMLKRRVRIWWEGERRWFHGAIANYTRASGVQVRYTDGDKQWYTKSEFEAYMGAAEWQWVRTGDVAFDDTKAPDRLPPIPPLCGSEVDRGCETPREMVLLHKDRRPAYTCHACGDFMWATEACKQHRSGPLCECGQPSLAIRAANGKGLWVCAKTSHVAKGGTPCNFELSVSQRPPKQKQGRADAAQGRRGLSADEEAAFLVGESTRRNLQRLFDVPFADRDSLGIGRNNNMTPKGSFSLANALSFSALDVVAVASTRVKQYCGSVA